MVKKNDFNKDCRVSARLHPSIKKKLVNSGYNARQAIEYFVRDYYAANPRKRVEVKRQILENDIETLKKQECEVQLEIQHKESLLDKLVVSAAVGKDDVDETEELVMDLPPDVQMGINIVQNVFDKKKDLEVSSRLSDSENIMNFIKNHNDFIGATYDEYGSDLSWREFRDLLLSEIVV